MVPSLAVVSLVVSLWSTGAVLGTPVPPAPACMDPTSAAVSAAVTHLRRIATGTDSLAISDRRVYRLAEHPMPADAVYALADSSICAAAASAWRDALLPREAPPPAPVMVIRVGPSHVVTAAVLGPPYFRRQEMVALVFDSDWTPLKSVWW